MDRMKMEASRRIMILVILSATYNQTVLFRKGDFALASSVM
jgi:hypothetical protein